MHTGKKQQNALSQWFSTRGTCTPRGTFAYLRVHLRLAIEGENVKKLINFNRTFYMKFYEKFSGFLLFHSALCHKKFGGTCSSVQMLKGWSEKGWESLL